jgi:hypothetical protein
MKEIGKILAGICAFFFVISGVSAILLFNIERKAFSADTYKQAFKEQGLYTQTPLVIANAITESANDNNKTSALLSIFNKDELAFIISSLLPPAEIEAVTNAALDSAFAFINDDTDSIMISLLPLKENITGEAGVGALTQILQTKPACTTEQILQMGFAVISSNPGLTLCNPPEEVLQLVTPLIESELQFITQSIPDELTLVTADQTEASNFRSRLDKIRAVMKLTLLLPLFLLITLTLFAVRSLKDWLKWWGVPLLMTGLLTIMLAMIGTPLVRLFIETVILQGNTNIPFMILGTIKNITALVASQVLKPVAIEGIVLILIGIGMVFGAVVTERVFNPSKTGIPTR